MTKKQFNDEEIKQLILQTVKEKAPENGEQLIDLMQGQEAISPEHTANLLVDLERERKLNFTKHQQQPRSQERYVFSQKGLWYWTTIAFALAAIVAAFSMPVSNGYELYVRLSLALVFSLFLPGYALMKLILPTKVGKNAMALIQSQTSDESMVHIESFALSVGLSLVLVPIFGLILLYTPFGLRLEPIIFTLSLFTVGFATLAFYQESRNTSN